MSAPSETGAGLYQSSIRDGFDGDGLLDQSEKQFATVSGCSTVEAKGELVQVVVQMCVTYGALMGAEQPAFEQRDHAVDPWQQFGGDCGVSAKERHTMVSAGLDPFVAVPSIGV